MGSYMHRNASCWINCDGKLTYHDQFLDKIFKVKQKPWNPQKLEPSKFSDYTVCYFIILQPPSVEFPECRVTNLQTVVCEFQQFFQTSPSRTDVSYHYIPTTRPPVCATPRYITMIRCSNSYRLMGVSMHPMMFSFWGLCSQHTIWFH